MKADLLAKKARETDASWDYKGESTKSLTHGFHTYPAMFIPQVASRIIRSYSGINDTILDIFCGSGTSLIEARAHGRNSVGIDLNPLAFLLAKVKTTPLNIGHLRRTFNEKFASQIFINTSEVEPPKFKNIDFWFKAKVKQELAWLKQQIDTVPNVDERDFFLVAFSETVRYSSNTRNGEFKLYRMAPTKLQSYNPDTMSFFFDKCENNIKGLEAFMQVISEKHFTKVIYGDSRLPNNIPDESIDLIVTSPPYGDSKTTVAYGQFSRLSLQWIGLPDEDANVDGKLLGGKFSAKQSSLPSPMLSRQLDSIIKIGPTRAKEVQSFYYDLYAVLKNAHRVLKKDKKFVLVVGNRTVQGITLETDFIISELAEHLGFITEKCYVRNIPNKRMPLQNSPTNIKGKLSNTMHKESILVLKKPNDF